MKSNCDQCNKEFASAEALSQHNKSKHPEQYKKPKANAAQGKTIRKWIITVIVLSIIIMGIYLFFQKDQNVSNDFNLDLPSGPIHWHPRLKIIIDSKVQDIPANIGLGAVHQPIHTHDEDAAEGVIHMEIDRPTKQNVVLGYFFDIWKKKFSKDCIFEYCADKGVLKMTVNGKENLDYENYFMRDKDEIVIEYVSNTAGNSSSQ